MCYCRFLTNITEYCTSGFRNYLRHQRYHVQFWMNKCTTFTPLGFCFLYIVIVTVFEHQHASVFNLKMQKIIKYQINAIPSNPDVEFYDNCIKRINLY